MPRPHVSISILLCLLLVLGICSEEAVTTDTEGAPVHQVLQEKVETTTVAAVPAAPTAKAEGEPQIKSNALIDGLMNGKCDEALSSFGLILGKQKCSKIDQDEANKALAKATAPSATELDWQRACQSSCVLSVVKAGRDTISSGCNLQDSKSTVFHKLLKKCKSFADADVSSKAATLEAAHTSDALVDKMIAVHKPQSQLMSGSAMARLTLQGVTKPSLDRQTLKLKLAQALNVEPATVNLAQIVDIGQNQCTVVLKIGGGYEFRRNLKAQLEHAKERLLPFKVSDIKVESNADLQKKPSFVQYVLGEYMK